MPSMKKASSSPSGLFSSKGNPMPKARQVPRGCGSSGNKDAAKANKLLHKAYAEKESLRGKMG